MLRPMIESMQNGISQQGGNLDPYGAGLNGLTGNTMASLSSINSSSSYGYPSSFGHTNISSTSSSSTVQTSNAASMSKSGSVVTTTTPSESSSSKRVFAQLSEEKCLVSSDIDGKTLKSLMGKILNCTNDLNEKVLTEEESQEITKTIEELSSDALVSFPHVSFIILGKLLSTHKSLHMATLFILRLLALHVHKMDSALCGRDSALYASCQQVAHNLLDMVKAGEGSFSSASALVMGYCTLANLITSPAGCQLLFCRVDDDLTASEALLSSCIDASTCGLSHSKAEVRQMAITLAYNLALTSTRPGAQTVLIRPDTKALPWCSLHSRDYSSKTVVKEDNCGDSDELELHQHIVQLLCAILETVGEETDAVSLGRKLHTAYYVCVAGGKQAKDLLLALGFDDHVENIRKRQKLLSETDRLRLSNFELLLSV